MIALLVAILAGVIVAIIAGEGRFAPKPTPEMTDSLVSSSTLLETTLPPFFAQDTSTLSVQPTSQSTQSFTTLCLDTILVGTVTSGIYKIDTATGRVIETTGSSSIQLGLLAWNPIRQEAYSADYNGDVVSIIKPTPLREIGAIRRNVGWNAYSVAVSQDGDRFYAAFSTGGDNISYRQIVIFNPEIKDSIAIVHLTDTYGDVYLTLSHDSEYLFVSWDSNINIYSTQDMSLVRHESAVTSTSGRLAISSDNHYLFIAQSGQLVKWNVDKGSIEATLSLPGINGNSWIEISEDDQRIFVGGRTHESIIYEVQATLDNFDTIRLPVVPYNFVQSSDGLCLYCVSFDNGVVVTELSTGKSQTIEGIQNATGVIVITQR